jgi:hypothetical protein
MAFSTPAKCFNEQFMDQERWTEVDRYITERVLPADPALEAALAASDAAGLPAIQVSPNMGKLLQLLAQSIGGEGSSRLARSAATAQSGLHVQLPLAGAWSHLNSIQLLPKWRDPISHVQVSPRG